MKASKLTSAGLAGWQPEEEMVLQMEGHDLQDPLVSARPQVLFLKGLWLVGWAPTTFWRVIYAIPSTDLNINLV